MKSQLISSNMISTSDKTKNSRGILIGLNFSIKYNSTFALTVCAMPLLIMALICSESRLLYYLYNTALNMCCLGDKTKCVVGCNMIRRQLLIIF